MILAGDVGGTKTLLALYEDGADPRRPQSEARRASRDDASLEILAREFVAASGAPRIRRAVLGVAGPVADNRCETTNLPWTVSGDALSKALGGAEVTLINDLEAAGWGTHTLGAGDLDVLQRGESATGNRAMISAGTGLGVSILAWNGARHVPVPSEGGHADFAPADALEDELLLWLRARHGHVSWERVLSGPGLADLYRFLAATGRGEEPSGMSDRIEAAPEPAAVITAAALDGSCERARLAVAKFVEIYGAAAGNVALTALAVGGVYVGGGIAPRLLAALRDGRFVRAFRAKGRLEPLLARVPVSVILDARVGLWGAAAVALEAPVPARAARA